MEQYELLWQCYLSEQMTTKQLEIHTKEDPEFASFVEQKLKEHFGAI